MTIAQRQREITRLRTEIGWARTLHDHGGPNCEQKVLELQRELREIETIEPSDAQIKG